MSTLSEDEILGAYLQQLIESHHARDLEHQQLLQQHEEILQQLGDLSTMVLSMLEQMQMSGFFRPPDLRGLDLN